MDMISLRYTGGKSIAKLYFNRVRYVFNKENNFTTEVPDKIAWDKNTFAPALIEKASTSIPFDGDSDTVELSPEKPIDETVCDVCGFKAKSKSGTMAHKRAKHKGE